MAEGKRILNGKPVFCGLERAALIDKGSKENVEARGDQILDECGQIGIMIGCDCTVPSDNDGRRLVWVRQAAIHYAEK